MQKKFWERVLYTVTHTRRMPIAYGLLKNSDFNKSIKKELNLNSSTIDSQSEVEMSTM